MQYSALFLLLLFFWTYNRELHIFICYLTKTSSKQVVFVVGQMTALFGLAELTSLKKHHKRFFNTIFAPIEGSLK